MPSPRYSKCDIFYIYQKMHGSDSEPKMGVKITSKSPIREPVKCWEHMLALHQD